MKKIKIIILISCLIVSSVGFSENSVLFASYNFDDCKATDSSTNHNNGIIHGNPTCKDEPNGNYLSFSNSNNSNFDSVYKNDWVELPKYTGNSLTFEARVKWEPNDNDEAAIWSIGDHGEGNFVALFVNPSTGKLFMIGQKSNPFDISNGSWYKVKIVVINNTISLYVNNSLIETFSNPLSSNFNNSPQYLSYHQWGNGNYSSSRFSGAIDDVKISTNNIIKHDITPNSYIIEKTFNSDLGTIHLNTGEYRYYYFPKQINKNTTVNLPVVLGNCDLYGYTELTKPTDTPHSKSVNVNGNESFSFKPTKQGYYYVVVKAESSCDFNSPTVYNTPLKLVGKYTIGLNKEDSISIISTGLMNLQGMLLNSNNDYVDDLDNISHVNHGYITFSPYKKNNTPKIIVSNNFMISPGKEKDAKNNLIRRRVLTPGNYNLLISPDTDEKGFPTSDTKKYGVLVLKKPNIDNEISIQSNDFFTGLNLLVNDGDASNDYMDIYVRALYPHLIKYNWGNTVAFNNVPKERQCKALNNFYLFYILNGQYMNTDDNIRANWKTNNRDMGFTLLGGTGNQRGDIIYNSYSTLNDLGLINKGDIFTKDRGSYNHYGLYFESAQIDSDSSELTQIIDANGDGDGKIHIVPAKKRRAELKIYNSWKVARSSALQ